MIKPQFDKSKPLIVRKVFKCNGKTLPVGDLFNWRRMSIAWRRVAQLFDANYLTHPKDEDLQAIKELEELENLTPVDDQQTEVLIDGKEESSQEAPEGETPNTESETGQEEVKTHELQPGDEIFVASNETKDFLLADMGNDPGVTVTVNPEMFALKEDGLLHPVVKTEES